MAEDHDQFEYDVALSFAGEDREVVRKFAKLLEAKHINVFYDETEIATLWGKNLIDHLADIYGKQARYCVMFISKYYPLKKWTNYERTQAQARAFRDANEYILPIRLDDTEVPGIAETTGYIDLRQHSLDTVANVFEQKLAKSKGQNHSPNSFPKRQPTTASSNSPFGTIPMPKRKPAFTQLDKDRFAKEAFKFVRQYFQQALKQLENNDSDIQTEFDDITNFRFTSKIYIAGVIKAQCSIWLGDDLISNTIYYSEGTHQLSSGINDYLPVADDNEKLYLQIGSFGLSPIHVEESKASQQQAAEYLWMRFIHHLGYR